MKRISNLLIIGACGLAIAACEPVVPVVEGRGVDGQTPAADTAEDSQIASADNSEATQDQSQDSLRGTSQMGREAEKSVPDDSNAAALIDGNGSAVDDDGEVNASGQYNEATVAPSTVVETSNTATSINPATAASAASDISAASDAGDGTSPVSQEKTAIAPDQTVTETAAATIAPPPPPPPPPELKPASLVGSSVSGLAEVLGEADLLRREGKAEIWQYRLADCTVDYFIYPEDNGARVLDWAWRSTIMDVAINAEKCRQALAKRSEARQ